VNCLPYPKVKIIAISGSGKKFQTMVKDLGAPAALEKPFHLNEMLEAVAAAVG